MRSIALVVVAAYVFIDVPFPQAWLYVGFLVVFLIPGMAHRYAAVALFPASWPSYVFILADSCILAYAFVAANPLGDDQWPVQMRLRNAGFGFFYVFLAATLPTFSPRKVLWSGISAVLAWTAVIAWIGNLPETVVGYGGAPFEQPGGNIAPGPFADPHFIYLGGLVRDMFVLLVVSGILATVVWRVRAMMLRQSETERQRANLARYFSPNMVEELAGADQSFDTVRQHDAAVLFVDMVGFTGFAESHGPEEIFAVLREFHGLMAEQIFANDGTLDKYIGDAVMATFGVPPARPARRRQRPGLRARHADGARHVERAPRRRGRASGQGDHRRPLRARRDRRHRRRAAPRIRRHRRHGQCRQPARAPDPRARHRRGVLRRPDRRRAPRAERTRARCSTG